MITTRRIAKLTESHNRRAIASESGDWGYVLCDLSAIAAEDRAKQLALVRSLLSLDASSTSELTEGISFALLAARFGDIVRFVEHERRCCTHFRFVIEVPPQGSDIELRITGTGVREGLAAILLAHETPQVASEGA